MHFTGRAASELKRDHLKGSYLPLWIVGQVYISTLNSKIRYFGFLNSRYRTSNLRRWFLLVVYLFSFMFILDKTLKNYSESQKNHKIDILILLYFTWVDICSEYIIWYNLLKIVFLLLDVHFSIINSYLHFLWFNYSEIFMVVK